MTILADVPMIQYVADSFGGERPPSLNSSIAHLLLTRSPAHARHDHPRLSPAAVEEEETRFDIGTAAHALLLEGEDRVQVVDAPDWRKKEAQAARLAARAAGKIPLLPDQASAVASMVLAAKQAITACPDLEGYAIADMLAERTILWTDGPQSTHCRCRPDWLSRDHRLVISYKTCAAAQPDAFTRQMLNLGYVLQSAFECRAIELETGIVPTYIWLATEVDPPHGTSLIGLSPMMADLATRQYRAALALWSECMATGEWPGYPAQIVSPDPPEWALSRFIDRHGYDGAGEPVDDGRSLDEQLFGGLR